MDSFQILREIGDALNSSLEPGEIFKIVLDKCIKFTRSDTGSIITIDKETKILHIEHQVGLGTRAEDRVKLKIGEGVTGTAAKEKKALLINDVSQSPVYVTVNRAIKSEIAVPIIFKNRLLGVISVDSKSKDNYKKDDLELLTIVGGQVGQVLTNLEYFQDLRLRLTHDEILMEINRVLSSSLDMTNTLEEALVILKKSGLFERGALILPSAGTEILEMKTNFGYSKTESAKATYRVNEGVVGSVYKSSKPEAIKDVKMSPAFLDKTDARKSEMRQLSFFCIPLISGAQTIGIMIFDQVYSNSKSFDNSFEFLKKLETQISKSLQIHFLAQKEKTELQEENQALKNILTEKTSFSNIIGRSAKMKTVFDQLQAVSGSESTILITGESGTGKELVAAAIHFQSPRKNKAFIPINCAAIPENLLESELFGYKKGAFTGAVADKPGKFKLAEGGTIFLDEIGEMPLSLQSKLLRVLQERVLDPVGGSRSEPIDVRVIAATNKVLHDEIIGKRFREDLYYRLSIIPIHLPPLRERKEDIPLLVDYFLEMYKAKFSKPKIRLSEEAASELMRHGWGGNIRELRNVLERSVIFSKGDMIEHILFDERGQAAALPESGHEQSVEVRVPAFSFDEVLKKKVADALGTHEDKELQALRDQIEKVFIETCLRTYKGVHQQAARAMGISRETLRKRVRELQIDIYS